MEQTSQSETRQSALIGCHPNGDFFCEWLSAEDLPITSFQRHRKLTENEGVREFAINKISELIIKHHVDDKRLERIKKKREILGKHGFEEYMKNQSFLPTVDKTRKGNGTEVVLFEYLLNTTGLDLFSYRLRYNTNVNQSMKGDDILLLNRKDLSERIIIGEAKFRSNPTKASIDEITKEFAKETRLPLSITFLAQKMSDFGEEELAEQLEDLNAELHEGQTPIISVGFLLSNHNTASNVNRHLNSENPNFLFLSLGLHNPEEIILKSFNLAYDKLNRQDNESE